MLSTNCRKLRFGSAADITTFALQLVAVLQRDARGAAALDDDLLTGALVRISTPSARAELAIAAVTPPLPFLAKPQARNAPSISPM